MSNNKVFVYKEYNDGEAYGEELIAVFSAKAKAETYLRERVMKIYHCSLDELKESFSQQSDDTVENDYVSIASPKGTSFFLIEEREVA